VGLKDSCGDMKQTIELLSHKPAGFSILTGEDAMFYLTLALGGDGGILAASHLETEQFVGVYQLMKENNHQAALKKWQMIAPFVPLLFKEPNPAPIKYILKKKGLISSSEVRLPLTEISPELVKELEQVIKA
jgi:4-hydroxy-tetrahydrodipicolinate synthase